MGQSRRIPRGVNQMTHIDYNLAKELRDAGFPSKTFVVHEQYKAWENFPTLSELINACPKTLEGLNQNTKEKEPVDHLFRLGFNGIDEWFATYEFYQSTPLNKLGQLIDGWGRTPEIAVARLYLQLNSKTDL